jgi:penicillin-binding protein 2
MLNPGAYEDRRSLQTRLVVLRTAAIACFGLLAVAFWLLQVVQHAQYREMAENNTIRTIRLRAPRGILFDRNGRVLVENRYSFTIALVREQSADLTAAVQRLARIAGEDEAEMLAVVDRYRREPPFRPIPVIEHATFAQVAAVIARRSDLPEVEVQQVPTRTYPPGGMAAHLFGYVSQILESQIDRPEFAGLPAGSVVGQAGIERAYNERLMGRDGSRYVIVNSRGREIDLLAQEPPTDGDRLQLTIDYDLQRALEDAFEASGYNGAGVFLDPRTGEVLALTSRPGYNPNDFATGIDREKLQALLTDQENPFQNRLIQGTYSPGSTFKIVMAIAGLGEGVITPETQQYCPGSATLFGRTFRCHLAGGHGWVNVRHALEQSCNVFFYKLGERLSIDTIYEYASKLGLVGKTGIDLPGERDSLVPSTEWKRRTTGEPWYPGETISVAIGQGAVSVTPLALATMAATVANGGTLITPHLVRAADNGQGWQMLDMPAPRAELRIEPAHLAAVHDGLWLAVNGAGTAGRARLPGRDVAGKTGTAQLISIAGARAAAGRTDLDLRDNGWFVFFAPKDNPQIAGVVFAEHSEHGYLAAPIAKFVMETFFAKQEGRPPPELAPAIQVRSTPPATVPAADESTPGASGPDEATEPPAGAGTPAAPVDEPVGSPGA